MNNPHRIHALAVSPDVARQTPKNDFGDVMAQALKTGVGAASALMGGFVPGVPVLSAAVSGIQATLNAGSLQTGGSAASVAAPVAGLGAIGAGPSSSGAGASLGSIQGESTGELLQSLASNPNGSSAAYLELQMRMAQESEQFTALSNVLKVRADSAKAAINNIR